MNKEFTETTTLIFKNIPKDIKDLTNLLNSLNIPAKEIKPFGRKRALITYELKSQAQNALDTLRETEFSRKTANVFWFCKDKPKDNHIENIKSNARKLHKGVQTNVASQPNPLMPQQVSKYVKKLYATEGDLGFDQPPPPYLKYNYPPINKNILDNICISLLSNKRFYTQVLHLMNRMNLEPPFTERKYKFTPPGIPQEAGTQTEEEEEEKKFSQKVVEEEIETEMESSEEDEAKRIRPQLQIKRKLPPQPEQYKKKARQILQTTQKLSKETAKRPSTTSLSIKEIFEAPEHCSAATAKIELQLKRPQNVLKTKQTDKTMLNLSIDLKSQKVSLHELEVLPIYKNYQKGEVSNKLYIKNLHKDVTTEDLQLIYGRYIKDNNFKLDIKLMQHGRMKGQAFVTFQGDQMEILHSIVDQALDETNGFILRDKPMVVCYGKQS